MKKDIKIKVWLTHEQYDQLKPLFEITSRNKMKGVVIGQAWATCAEDAHVSFAWMTLDQLIEIAQKAKKEIIED